MTTIDSIIIGAGQAGLAVSWHLRARGLDHVVFDRGRVGERWRSERWESLRTLTPNWMTRLPGADYDGPDPEGFMTMSELIATFEAYTLSFAAPILEQTPVQAVALGRDGFEVVAGGTSWRARNVVVATGWADRPAIPRCADRLPAGSSSSPERRTDVRSRSPANGCWLSAPRHQAPRSPASWREPAATSHSRSAAIDACPAATAVATSCGAAKPYSATARP
jgi:glycine/D-amino acid oxidase-like deaminating enzyme